MFFDKKPKCPITTEDRDFINDCFDWISKSFGDTVFSNQYITPEQFNFSGKREDVPPILKFACQKMEIDEKAFTLHFYNERKVGEFAQDMTTKYEEGTELTTGKYKQYNTNKVEIWIEESTLQRPYSLVATIAHELAHFKLLFEGRLKENDEALTDLLTIFYGFGLFGANASITQMQTWSTGTGSGWNVTGGEGYLHYKLWAFAMAKLVLINQQGVSRWIDLLEKEVRKEFDRSVNYLAQ